MARNDKAPYNHVDQWWVGDGRNGDRGGSRRSDDGGSRRSSSSADHPQKPVQQSWANPYLRTHLLWSPPVSARNPAPVPTLVSPYSQDFRLDMDMLPTSNPKHGSTPQVANLVAMALWRARRQPDDLAYTFLADGETEEIHLTYAQLDRRARAVAATIAKRHTPGSRALLVYEPGLEYITTFFGCLYAGVLAVPVYPPDPMRMKRTLPRLEAIVRDAQAKLVLSTRAILGWASGGFGTFAGLEDLIATDEIDDSAADRWQSPDLSPDSTAFIQYTSGSTGVPKGVVLTHGNLLSDLTQIHRLDDDDVTAVCWLPPYHDMGLIGCVLQPVFSGRRNVLMSPLAFVARPLRWLSAMTRYRGRTSGSPNFGYELCVRKISAEDREQLDLSSWTLAFNGAEPIRPETMDRFVEAFGPCGFRREAFLPCYGLAEATLFVAGGNKREVPVLRGFDAAQLEQNRFVPAGSTGQNSRTLVGCGQAIDGLDIAIVDPETHEAVSQGNVGELWLRGPTVATGYWNKADETKATFEAHLAESGEGPYLRTGDLGFVDTDDELFITGRLKDLIIIAGRNHYPQDIEQTVERVDPALKPEAGAAFSVDGECAERLVVIHEVRRPKRVDLDRLLVEIRHEVAAAHDLPVHAIVLIKSGSIPKTTSGKIQHRACRQMYLDGTLQIVAQWERDSQRDRMADDAAPYESPVGSTESALARLWCEMFGLDRVGRADDFFELGGHSLLATQLVSRIREAFQIELPLRALFEAPTLAELATRIDQASTESTKAIGRAKRDGPLPLSFAQQRLWFLDQLEPNNAFYNVPAAARLTGPLDSAALERAADEIVRRHESLRTTFANAQGQPQQVIGEQVGVSWNRFDLSSLPDEQRENALAERLTAEARRPFDLTTGPLLRAALARLGEEEHVVLLTMHHIISDGWSIGVLLDELTRLYEAFRDDQPSPLPEPKIQYADFAAWQHESLDEAQLEEQLDYWRDELGHEEVVLELPTDRPRPAVETFHGANLRFELDGRLSEGLDQLSRQEGVTLFMTLLAAYQTLLYRYSGQTDIRVGTPIANRTRIETESLIGFFANTLVLKSDLSDEPAFRELLGRVRQTTLSAYAHQDLPFEKLVEELEPRRDTSRSPLFQVAFVLQNAPLELPQRSGLEMSPEWVDTQTAKHDLTLFVWQDPQGRLLGHFEYNRDLFDEETIQRLIGTFTTLLEGIVTSVEQTVSELPLLTEAERHTILYEWNDTEAPFSDDCCIHQLVQRQAQRTPQAVAVEFLDQSLTYEELDTRANRLAHHLQSLGAGPEVLVGLAVERSVEMIVGLLGILKAGAAYVPLDPTYPAARLAWMFQDSQMPLLVTSQDTLERLPANDAQIVCLDRDQETIAAYPATPPKDLAGPDNLAYLIYTSGSTGTPKGVEIEHRGVVNFLESFARQPGLCSGDTLAAVTTLSFDIAAMELFLPLSVGARVVIVPREVTTDGERLTEALAHCAATVMQATPATWQLLLAAGWQPPEGFVTLCGGEALRPDLAQHLRAGGGSLWNLYGPTETTIWSAVECVDAYSQRVPIGRPIANTSIYILDAHQRLLPPGVPGELWIGGTGLSRGYHGRSDLTDERFVTVTLDKEKTERLYRTGDTARFTGDGTLDFLGRNDNQLKIRGFRIEPGEIESVLTSHPAVREVAVIVADEHSSEECRLFAYLACASGERPTADELRHLATEHLPAYMVPAAFVVLDELPRTPNGKLDRSALPIPGRDRVATAPYESPVGSTESDLARLWCEMFGLDRVGRADDFFELGGHSLLATQLVSRIREAFQIELPLRALFEAPTLAELATRIDQASTATELAAPIGRAKRDGPLPLSFAQQRLWFLDQLEPNNPFYNVPAAARLTGPLDTAALERAADEIVRRHESLRTTFANAQGQPQQVIGEQVCVPWNRFDLTALPDEQRENALAERLTAEARRPFDLTTGPLLRAALARLGKEEHIVLLTMHHIISDGWSIGVLLDELTRLYEAFRDDQPSPLPEPKIQYADFAAWQHESLDEAALEEQLDYWRNELGHEEVVLELPTDRPRPAVETFHGANLRFELDEKLSGRLDQLSRQEGVTLFMTLLAAYQTLLYRYSGQTDIRVGTPIANRTRIETESLIGFFANTLVLKSDLSDEPAFRELLARVRQTTLSAYAHQDLPFEKLVEELEPRRDTSRSPLFQVAFVLQNAPLELPQRSGLEMSPEWVDTQTAKHDLTLFVWQDPQGRLVGHFEYNRDLFDEETIRRIIGTFTTLLEGIVTSVEQTVAELPLLTEAERHTILYEWNDTAAPFSDDCCIHQLVQRQAQRTPQAVAVEFLDQSLTYEELDTRANRLAHHLQSLGAGPEVLVGLAVERSVEMIVGLLGILKAGAAYVPLDPTYPAARLAWMFQDSQMPLLVTSQDTLERLPANDAQIVCLDRDQETIAAYPATPPENLATADNLAYLIYTSGSTGTPKGVEIEHRGLCNLIEAQVDIFDIHDRSRVLQFASVCFDASVAEIFTALIAGGTLCLAPRETLLPGSEMIEFLDTHRISTATLPPSVLAALPETELPHMETIVSAGEACTVELVERWGTTCRFFNGYGPTEVTVGVAAEVCRVRRGRSLIGGRFQNMQMYVLDKNRSPVPIGTPGEIFIGGVGVARGYLNRPELTAGRFVDDPFRDEPSARLYRTGDRARLLFDGRLDFLGRVDHQLKIRGYRIEPGEIENELTVEQTVRDAVVVPYLTAGEQRLAAYVVPDFERAETASRNGERKPADEQIDHWELVFDENYRNLSASEEPTCDFTGWNSSYTGRPIDRGQMRVWLDQTVAAIRELNPRRVLEIGCGNGLVLFKAVPHCREYVGTDISPEAVGYVERLLSEPGRELDHVRVEARAADDFRDIEEDYFDVVVLNSVVQYFPDVEYLLRVIEGACRVVRPGGHIFLGDVRSLPLSATFHASVALNQAPDEQTRGELAETVARRLEQEQELAIDPAFFRELPKRFPEFGGVQLCLKRGTEVNELNKFRYDVVLHLEPHAPSDEQTHWHDWQGERFNVEIIRKLLPFTGTTDVGMRGVPNARLAADLQASHWLSDESGPDTVGEFRARLSEGGDESSIDPEVFWALGKQLNHRVEITLSRVSEGRYDVRFRHNCPSEGASDTCRCRESVTVASLNGETANGEAAHRLERSTNGDTRRRHEKPTNGAATNGHAKQNGASRRSPSTGNGSTERSWRAYANNPLRGMFSRQLVPQWRKRLEERLPDYMVPSAFVLMDDLPRLPNGKVDRLALPSPSKARPHWSGEFIAPRDELEEELVRIWEELLDVHPIGVTDNFFELGGHSMIAVRLVAEIQEHCGRSVPLSSLFQYPTIEHLGRLIRCEENNRQQPLLVPIQPHGDRRPLFCVHPAGGTVFCYLELARQLGTDQPLYGLQAQGIDGQEPPLTRFADMAARYVEEIRTLQPKGPYQLAGWSLGGNLAYEMARQLTADGAEVSLLALLDSGTMPPETQPTEEDFLRVMLDLFPGEVPVSLDELRRLPVDGRLTYFLEKAQRAQLVAPDSDSEAGRHVLEVFQATLQALSDYRPGRYEGKVTLLRVTEHTTPLADDPELGWGEIADGGVDVYVTEGDHVGMLRQPGVRQVAQRLGKLLAPSAEATVTMLPG